MSFSEAFAQIAEAVAESEAQNIEESLRALSPRIRRLPGRNNFGHRHTVQSLLWALIENRLEEERPRRRENTPGEPREQREAPIPLTEHHIDRLRIRIEPTLWPNRTCNLRVTLPDQHPIVFQLLALANENGLEPVYGWHPLTLRGTTAGGRAFVRAVLRLR